jgi:uncharacterized Rmd1/YagE family protein
MDRGLSIAKSTVTGRALLLGERIDLRALEATDRIAPAPLTVSVQGGGVAVLFRYGAVVLFDVAPMEEASFLAAMKPLVGQPYPQPETESVEIRVDPAAQERMEGGAIYFIDGTVERLQLLADVLGKSVALARYEATIAQAFDLIEPFATGLERRRRGRHHGRELLKLIGGTLSSEQKMIGRVAVGDKPDVLWERPDLERLYERLEDEFEIRERHEILERKLELVSRTANTVLELMQDARMLRVEWYIVILIVFEILLTLYQMFFLGR